MTSTPEPQPDGQPSDGQPSDGQPSDGQASAGQPAPQYGTPQGAPQASAPQYGTPQGGQPDYRPQPGQAPAFGGKRLVRRRDDRMLGGVCSGAAAYLNIDVTLVRVLVAVGTLIGFGSLAIAYIIAWVLLPEE